MSRSVNKIAILGFAVANHRANSIYYKDKRRAERRYFKNKTNELIKCANDYDGVIESNYNIIVTHYDKRERKLLRNEYDEPTDGRYRWFKKRKNKKNIVGRSFPGYKNEKPMSAEELYIKYIRK